MDENLLFIVFLVVIAYFLCLWPSGAIVRYFLGRIFSKDDLERIQKGGIANAGTYIGFLERILIVTFIFVDQYVAIGFLVTAKSIFRFESLTVENTEYFLIGTFLSFALGLFIGIVSVYLIGLF
jgi:hypothetical protein